MTNSEHTSKQFDIELDALRNTVQKMGALVSKQFQLAIDSLNSGDKSLIREVLDLSYQVNNLEVDIDWKCNLILAKRQPEAVDLRTILTILKITTDLERMGDQVESIARRLEMIFQQEVIKIHRSLDICHCAGLALDMTHNAMEAFLHSDVSIATQVIRQDNEVNKEYSFITRSLIGRMLEDPRTISTGLHFLLILKDIERIGDHAKNISKYVIFMVKGKDVRHSSIEEIEGDILDD